ncbi:hypothetical protein AQ875_17180 [Burkholderia pseudomallei]|nr:hypothetical protein AQ875_17180 [Burkholderia pseudomallei]
MLFFGCAGVSRAAGGQSCGESFCRGSPRLPTLESRAPMRGSGRQRLRMRNDAFAHREWAPHPGFAAIPPDSRQSFFR